MLLTLFANLKLKGLIGQNICYSVPFGWKETLSYIQTFVGHGLFFHFKFQICIVPRLSHISPTPGHFLKLACIPKLVRGERELQPSWKVGKVSAKCFRQAFWSKSSNGRSLLKRFLKGRPLLRYKDTCKMALQRDKVLNEWNAVVNDQQVESTHTKCV